MTGELTKMLFACRLIIPGLLASVSGLQSSDGSAVEISNRQYFPEAHLTTPELVSARGYPAESHTVVTEDGYILTLHRIPHGRAGPSGDRPPVLVQHGLLCSSAVWVLSATEKALGFVLADAGYDVWMGNYRGNHYANKHVTLKNTDSQYWQFSWHESGVYDLPAMIDYILERTGQKQLYYVGHSMGNTGFYVMASTRPEYNDKVKAQFSLAPVAFMGNVKSPVIRLMSSFQNSLDVLLKMIGVNEFAPNSEFMAQVASVLCPDGAFTQDVCSNIIFMLCGFNKQQFNTTLLPIIPGHVPAGSSTKQMLHYSQEIHSRKFRQYDYGAARNLFRYGSISPPEYDLSKITTPIFLYWSDNDWLASQKDVLKLEQRLKSVKKSKRVPNDKFNHVDHMWAIDILPLVYDDLLAEMSAN